ncbi:sigma-54 interaction domain-containing protein [Desulforhopalus singaporensis]|uniref:Arginine utilization regulatory protein n=1 Tax=Desulforhopalus singaporensis TaxID=91360 RepID=A0A1H0M4Q7_9BACT|nr:sigma 54-interacting transcriptional regulator [Desulforhopalus singaporensis]SDO75120.1 arginine utilization regulatory protein [Desulforhopalus singaporensis]
MQKIIAKFDVNNIDFVTSVFDHFDEGVIITDSDGNIVYYNKTQAQIDGLDAKYAIGRKVTDIYQLSRDTSLIMLCIRSGEPMRNRTFFYKTSAGKVANTICGVFPIYSGDRVAGAICFVRDYKILKKTTPVVSVPDLKPKKKNGTRYTFGDILGQNAELVRSVHTAREAASSVSPIMIIGQTGTGKELFAQSIHNHSLRSNHNYVAVNCAAIPDHLLEGILFGTTKGAFTGAVDRAGLLEIANNSTLFLDELLAMPLNLQAKLLRVLQEKKVHRIGSVKDIDLNIKIVSSVNRSPREAINDGELRVDLFYRLGVVMIKIPPLAERKNDIPLLVNHFIKRLNRTLGTGVRAVSDEVMDLFENYAWPGNIRELEHLIEGAMNIVGYNDTIDLKHFSAAFESMLGVEAVRDAPFISETCSPPAAAAPDQTAAFGAIGANGENREPEGKSMATDTETAQRKNLAEEHRALEYAAIKEVLAATNGNISQSSKKLGISRQLLHYKMKKHGLVRETFIKGKNTAAT